MSRGYGNIVFLVATIALIAAHAVLAWIGFTHSPVDLDQGFNLSVVRNIAAGDGYSSDGVFTATGLQPFEVAITTGPTVIVPAALLHAAGMSALVAAYWVDVLFYSALVVGLAVCGWRIAGRWGSLLGASAPLLLDIFSNGHSPLYAPTDVLGEYACAAFIAWSLAFAPRRPVIAGLLLGAAIVTKVVALFAIPAVLVVYLVAHAGLAPRVRVALGLRAAGAVLLPLVAFEVVKLLSVGPTAYGALVSDYWQKTQADRLPSALMTDKLYYLVQAWFLPGAIAVALAVFAVAFASATLGATLERWTQLGIAARGRLHSERAALALGGLVAGAGTLAMWLPLTFTDPTWIRHPSPGLIIAAGLLLPTTLALIRVARGSGRWLAASAAVMAVALAVTLPIQVVSHLGAALERQRFGTLDDQRAIAGVLESSGTQRFQGTWSAMVPLAALADLPARNIAYEISRDDLLVLDAYPEGRIADQQLVIAQHLCGEVVLNASVIACWPRSDLEKGIAELNAEQLQQTPSTPVLVVGVPVD